MTDEMFVKKKGIWGRTPSYAKNGYGFFLFLALLSRDNDYPVISI